MKRKVFIYGLLGFLLGIAGFAAAESLLKSWEWRFR